MDVSNDDEEICLDQIRRMLSEWFQQLHTTQVRFTENTSPDAEPYASYTVAHEAISQPSDLNKARLELWATTDGAIAIGLETKGRIAERLGTRAASDKIFAAGHEPYTANGACWHCSLWSRREGLQFWQPAYRFLVW